MSARWQEGIATSGAVRLRLARNQDRTSAGTKPLHHAQRTATGPSLAVWSGVRAISGVGGALAAGEIQAQIRAIT